MIATQMPEKAVIQISKIRLQRAPLDFSHFRYGIVRGNAKGLRKLDFTRPQADFPVGDSYVDHEFVVDPGADAVWRHRNPETVPAALLKIAHEGGLILRCIVPVQTGEADHLAAPTTIDPGKERIIDRKRDASKKIDAIRAL